MIKLMNADEVNLRGQEVYEVRPSVLYHLIWYLIFICILVSMFLGFLGQRFYPLFPDSVPEEITEWFADLDKDASYIFLAVGVFMMFFVLMARSFYRGAKNPRGWLIKGTANGFYIQFRSYLNQKFDRRDDTVIFVPSSQVKWIREVRYEVVSTMRNSSTPTSHYVKAIEVNVRRLDADIVNAELHKELKRRSASGGRWNDSPVSVRENGIIRIEWMGVKPKPARFVELMKRWYMTQDVVKLGEKKGTHYHEIVIDGRGLSAEASSELKDDDIVKAVRSGDVIAAIKIAREMHGFGLKDAKDYVESLDLSERNE